MAVLLTSTDAVAAEPLAKREIGAALEEHVTRSVAAARRLDEGAPDAVRVATDWRAVAEITREVLERAGWI